MSQRPTDPKDTPPPLPLKAIPIEEDIPLATPVPLPYSSPRVEAEEGNSLRYSSPRIEMAASGQWGNLLLVPDGGDAGPLCVKCGQPGVRQFHKTYYHYPAALSILTLLCCLLFAILAIVLVILGLIFRKKARVTFMLCAHHAHRRRQYIGAAWLATFIGIVGLIAGFAFMAEAKSANNYGTYGGVSLVLGFAGLIGLAVLSENAKPLKPKKIFQKVATYKGASLTYLEKLPPAVPPPGW